MQIARLSPDFAATRQIRPEEVPDLAALGFRSLMCNRPDDEEPGQPSFAAVAETARRHGLEVAHVPVISGQIVPQNVEAFRAALGALPGPVLAYCRSGARSQHLWTLSR